jgi:hypothetical protein
MITNRENHPFALSPMHAFFVGKILLKLVLIVLLVMFDLILNLLKYFNGKKKEKRFFVIFKKYTE